MFFLSLGDFSCREHCLGPERSQAATVSASGSTMIRTNTDPEKTIGLLLTTKKRGRSVPASSVSKTAPLGPERSQTAPGDIGSKIRSKTRRAERVAIGPFDQISFGINLVRRGGLEPPRCYPLAPQASASANSAISALRRTTSSCSFAQVARSAGSPEPSGAPARCPSKDCCDQK